MSRGLGASGACTVLARSEDIGECREDTSDVCTAGLQRALGSVGPKNTRQINPEPLTLKPEPRGFLPTLQRHKARSSRCVLI